MYWRIAARWSRTVKYFLNKMNAQAKKLEVTSEFIGLLPRALLVLYSP